MWAEFHAQRQGDDRPTRVFDWTADDQKIIRLEVDTPVGSTRRADLTDSQARQLSYLLLAATQEFGD